MSGSDVALRSERDLDLTQLEAIQPVGDSSSRPAVRIMDFRARIRSSGMKSPVNPHDAPRPIEALLAEAEWIRDLARRLARDASEAEDLVQETWTAALASRPDTTRPARAWLTVVVANAARALRRSDARRGERERVAARPEAQPSTSEIIERAHAQRELVAAVLELDEPYREAVLLRFYEGLTPRAIARRIGVPSATVRSRIARGVALLRVRLDREHKGDRSAWVALLMPAPEHALSSSSVLGVALVNAKIILVATAAVAGLALVLILRDPSSPVAREPVPSRAIDEESADARDSRPHEPLRPTVPGSAGRISVEPAALRELMSDAPAAPASIGTRGRVLDADSRPLVGVPIAVEAPDGTRRVIATSVADGVFTASSTESGGLLVAGGTEWCTVLAAAPQTAIQDEAVVLVIAPSIDIHGTVGDEVGATVEGARLEVELPTGFRARFREVLDRSSPRTFRARAGVDGRFAFDCVPRILDARVRVAHEGFLSAAFTLADIPPSPWPIVLLRGTTAKHTVRGLVVDATGAPVAAARVALGIDTTKSAEDGTFVFDLEDLASWNKRFGVDASVLRALKPGFQPAELRAVTDTEGARWPSPIVLRLGAETLSIRGEVREADGPGRAGIQVWISDSTTFGAGREGPEQLENLLAGVEDRNWRWVETDADGRFEIGGLVARDYTLSAMDPTTLLRAESRPIPAGSTGIVLRMPAEGLFLRVAGVVRGYDGARLAGVSVGPMCDTFCARLDAQVISTSHARLERVITDADGRFALSRVSRSLVYLRLDGDAILPLEYGRYHAGEARFEGVEVRELPMDHIEDLDIRVERRARLQVELADPSRADAFALLDERGIAVELSTFNATGREEGLSATIVEGRSSVVTGTDRARALVLQRGGVEVFRTTVALVHGETTTLRP